MSDADDHTAGPSERFQGKQKVPTTPAHLRFQRRQSERAFVESQYRDITPSMEYPSGQSPWASSSDAGGAGSGHDAEPQDYSHTPTVQAHAPGGTEQEQEHHNGLGHGAGGEGSWSAEQAYHQWEQHHKYPQEEHNRTQPPRDQQRGLGEDNRRPPSSRYHNVQPPPQQQQQQQQPRQHVPQYKLQAKITALERAGKKEAMLRFDVYTNLPRFRTTQYRDIRRSHAEFQKLGAHLIASNPEALVPAVPPASTSAGIGTDEDDNRTKAAIQRWLNIVCSNGVLMRDDEMIFFVEADSGYSPVVRKKQAATGVRRKVLKQFAPPPDDTPELLESRPIVKAFYLGAMDSQQKVDKVVKYRRSLGLAESDMGSKVQALTNNEMHGGLANAYRKLGKVIQNIGDFHAAQGTAEAATLSDPLAYYSSDAFIVKETLTNRHILLRELAQAQQATRSRASAAERLKASSSLKSDKVKEAIAAVEEARSHEEYLQQRTQRVTQNLVLEKRKWFARTAADMRTAIREFAIREIDAERRTLATLEQVRPDVRNIDASGGLSRLGREAHPVAKRSSMASSQGPKGDAWSGVPRRADGLNRSISGSWPGAGPGEGEAGEGEGGRMRAASSAGSLGKLKEDYDDDRIDARNAASRLAQTTF